MSNHPLISMFSIEQRDRLLNMISFSIEPRKYHVDSLEMLQGAHIVNYSLLLESLSAKHRSRYVPLNDLKNGDILQFSDYREVGTYYCLWLSKDLVHNDEQEVKELLEALDDNFDGEEEEEAHEGEGSNDPESKKSKQSHQFTSLPFDFQVDFMPKPVLLEATTATTMERFPYSYPRDDSRVSGGENYHLYLFHHLDEYGFLGTTATSIAGELYFQAVKVESSSRVLLDPLLVHSQSYYGKLLEIVKERRPDFAANPFFPMEYIMEVNDITPAKLSTEALSLPTSEWSIEDKDAIMKHASDITWTPIDLACGSIINSGCHSSTLTPEIENQLSQIQSEVTFNDYSVKPNLFYEIRNVLSKHLMTLSSNTVTKELPLFNEEFLRDHNRFEKFFIIHTSFLELTSASNLHRMIPSYYVENPYNIYSSEKRKDIQHEVELELERKKAESASATEPDENKVQGRRVVVKRAFDHNTYREVENRLSLAWRELDEASKNVFNERSALQQKQADTIDRELPLYILYLKDHRAELVQSRFAANPSLSWFACEKQLVQSWLSINEETKAQYAKLQEKEEATKQLAIDAQSVIRSLSMFKSMDKTLKITSCVPIHPIAVAAGQLAEALTAKHNPEVLPPAQSEPKEEEYVYPPSEFNFTAVQKINRGTMMLCSASTRRPPAGFIAYVIDTHKLWESEHKYPLLSSDERFLEMTKQWQILSDRFEQGDAEANQEMHSILKREEEMEEVGKKQKAIRDEMRKKQREEMEAKRAANISFAGSNGTNVFGGFGAFGLSGSFPPPPPPGTFAPVFSFSAPAIGALSPPSGLTPATTVPAIASPASTLGTTEEPSAFKPVQP